MNRYCKKCKKKLSVYNKYDTCHSHPGFNQDFIKICSFCGDEILRFCHQKKTSKISKCDRCKNKSSAVKMKGYYLNK